MNQTLEELWTEGRFKVINEGTRPFDMACHGRQIHLDPGEEAFWPGKIMCALLGQPDVRNDEKIGNKNRTKIAEQLYTMYGWYQDDPVRTWDQMRPKIAVYMEGSGQRLATIVEDPDGTSLPELGVDTSKLPADIQRMIEQRVREALESALPEDPGVRKPGRPPKMRDANDG